MKSIKVKIYFERDDARWSQLIMVPRDASVWDFHTREDLAPFPAGTFAGELLETFLRDHDSAVVAAQHLHGPVTRITCEHVPLPWDASRDQQEPCGNCDHPYERHFDGYEDNRAVGCKYCECFEFVPRTREQLASV